MRSIPLVVAACAVILSGCGQFSLPKAVKPDDLPVPARLNARAPAFHATAADFSELTLADLAGKPAVAIGVDWEFAADADRWVAALSARFGGPGERYRVVKLLEADRVGVLAKLQELSGRPVDFLVSDDFAENYGFANLESPSEGPHVAVIGPDGMLQALVDGTVGSERLEKVSFALQAYLAPVARTTE
jgi:hypothetical protein